MQLVYAPGMRRWDEVGVARVCVCVSCALVLLAVAVPGAQAGSPSIVVIFDGSGKASLSSTRLEAGLANASITMFWTMTWQFPSELTESMKISGKASQTLLPAAGPPCSAPVTTNQTSPERLTNFPGKVGLPVPMIIGNAAKTCYDPGPGGGGTSWYAYYSGGTYTSLQARSVQYAEIPFISASDSKPACFPVRSIYWHDVIPASGGNTLTQDIQWEGVVYVEVNGHKDTSCKPPKPAAA